MPSVSLILKLQYKSILIKLSPKIGDNFILQFKTLYNEEKIAFDELSGE